MVNSANVVAVDLEADNGIIHAIDAVLLPPAAEEEAAEVAEEEEPFGASGEQISSAVSRLLGTPAVDEAEIEEEPGTVVDIAVADGRFTFLVEALVMSGLDEVLAGEGPFTVFAPLDDAFNALPPGVFEGLLSSPVSVQSTLAAHVVAGEFLAADILALDELTLDTLLDNAPITFSLDEDGNVILNDGEAMVIIADIVASNGVIHVIDGIILEAPLAAAGMMGMPMEASGMDQEEEEGDE